MKAQRRQWENEERVQRKDKKDITNEREINLSCNKFHLLSFAL